MIEKIFESDRLTFKPFTQLTQQEIQIIGDSWANPFNARYNATRDPHDSVKEITTWVEPTAWGNYYRVVYLKGTNTIVGTCRFGKYHDSKSYDVWDFGFNVLLEHWYKGYGAEIIAKIIELAKNNNAKFIRGGADIENYGSYKAMIKNSFVFNGIDSDGDYSYLLDLSKPKLTNEEIANNWNAHLAMSKKDFGAEKFDRLQYINLKIGELVKRVQNGEDINLLTKQYFEQLNQIEEFKFC